MNFYRTHNDKTAENTKNRSSNNAIFIMWSDMGEVESKGRRGVVIEFITMQ